MHMLGRCGLALATSVSLAWLALAFAGCGGGSSGSGVVVARVSDAGAITKQMLDHWIPVEAIVLHEERPSRPAPRGVVPDPPSYSACMTYMRTHPAQPAQAGKVQSVAQLRSGCQHRYDELKVLTLNTLILWYWTIGAGQELGLRVTGAEARAHLKERETEFYTSDGSVQKYKKWTGQTTADLLLRSKVEVFEAKISARLRTAAARLPKDLSAPERERALAKLTGALPPSKAWAEKTSCLMGYVVSGCMQYTGTQAPGIPN
jgi:hypothetical protein